MSRPNLFARCFPSVRDFAFLAPAILLFCIMNGAASLLADGDTGWHIRAGDWILDHHRLPTTDFFSFTKPGQPWFAWEWLWEVSFAWLHRLSGLAGVIIGSVVVLCITSMNLFGLVRQRSKSDLIAASVTVLAVIGMSIHFLARPHLFSFLFAVILLKLLNRWRESGGKFPWLVVLLFVIWANVHPGFAAGIIILCAYTAGDLANALATIDPVRRAEQLARFRQSAVLTGACVLAPLINPYGYRLYLHMYSFLSDTSAMTHINEYTGVDFRSPPGRMFELMLFLGAPTAISRLLKREFTVPILFVGWAHLALTAQRNIPFFMIVMAAPVALWLEETIATFRAPAAESNVEPIRFARFPLVSVLVIVLIFVLLRKPDSPPKFRPQYDPSVYPQEALAAVRQLGPSARMVTTDIWGGYLIYQLPGERVFWDGRADFYGSPYNLAALGTLMGRPGWHKTLEDNQITSVLIPVNLPLSSLLDQSAGWHAVHRDEVAVLYQLSPDQKTGQEIGKLAETGGTGRGQ